MPKMKSLNFVLPTDEEALNAIGQLFVSSGMQAENQISLRLWLTDVLQEAGRMAADETVEPIEGEKEAA